MSDDEEFELASDTENVEHDGNAFDDEDEEDQPKRKKAVCAVMSSIHSLHTTPLLDTRFT